ncbi:unnamed protein product [Pleuronectes platessa]|uniref:Uncharacterized protein n=1 Tax=Pleuronectes platessa TaxID=8262 RepID=A0A9N7Z0R1_PLEPL|nr:unnamed protein product [Pleuronectes platessa]
MARTYSIINTRRQEDPTTPGGQDCLVLRPTRHCPVVNLLTLFKWHISSTGGLMLHEMLSWLLRNRQQQQQTGLTCLLSFIAGEWMKLQQDTVTERSASQGAMGCQTCVVEKLLKQSQREAVLRQRQRLTTSKENSRMSGTDKLRNEVSSHHLPDVPSLDSFHLLEDNSSVLRHNPETLSDQRLKQNLLELRTHSEEHQEEPRAQCTSVRSDNCSGDFLLVTNSSQGTGYDMEVRATFKGYASPDHH